MGIIFIIFFIYITSLCDASKFFLQDTFISSRDCKFFIYLFFLGPLLKTRDKMNILCNSALAEGHSPRGLDYVVYWISLKKGSTNTWLILRFTISDKRGKRENECRITHY